MYVCVCVCGGDVCVCVCECVSECVRACVCVRESVCFSFSVRRKRSVICLLVSSRPSLEVRVLQIAGEGELHYTGGMCSP